MSIKATNVRTNIVLPKSLKAELEVWAAEDNRSVNNMIVTILLAYGNERRKMEAAQAEKEDK